MPLPRVNILTLWKKKYMNNLEAVANTINGKLGEDDVLDNIFGLGSSEVFSKIKRIQFVALWNELACR